MAGANGLSSKSGPTAAKGVQRLPGAPGVAKLNMDGVFKYQVAGSARLYKTEAVARANANAVAKKVTAARANAKVATIKTDKGERYQVPGSYKLYRSKKSALRVASDKAAERALTGT